MKHVLVTGATGSVGSSLLPELFLRGVPVRVFVRDGDAAASLFGGEFDYAAGDFDDLASVERAVEGVDQVFLASPNHPQQEARERAFIDAAVGAGVRRIVKLSAIGAEIGSPLAFWDTHGRIEAHLHDFDPSAVVLRPAFYMSGLLALAAAVRDTGRLFLPAGDATVAMVDPRDVAAVAATVLARSGDEGRTYRLTGMESLAFADVAERLSATIGRAVTYVDVPPGEARAAMLGSGMPEWLADNLVILFGLIRTGALAGISGDVQEVTGREPRRWAQFVAEHAGAFL